MYQKCPVCHGTGLVSTPLWVDGDQKCLNVSITISYPCLTCRGSGIIYIPSQVENYMPAIGLEEDKSGKNINLKRREINALSEYLNALYYQIWGGNLSKSFCIIAHLAASYLLTEIDRRDLPDWVAKLGGAKLEDLERIVKEVQDEMIGRKES